MGRICGFRSLTGIRGVSRSGVLVVLRLVCGNRRGGAAGVGERRRGRSGVVGVAVVTLVLALGDLFVYVDVVVGGGAGLTYNFNFFNFIFVENLRTNVLTDQIDFPLGLVPLAVQGQVLGPRQGIHGTFLLHFRLFDLLLLDGYSLFHVSPGRLLYGVLLLARHGTHFRRRLCNISH